MVVVPLVFFSLTVLDSVHSIFEVVLDFFDLTLGDLRQDDDAMFFVISLRQDDDAMFFVISYLPCFLFFANCVFFLFCI